uniref:G domain-containing protein n=1 Tax=Palpitomonas bilix TaxID=652834 RepID=A0A7S3G1V6_9EUKA
MEEAKRDATAQLKTICETQARKVTEVLKKFARTLQLETILSSSFHIATVIEALMEVDGRLLSLCEDVMQVCSASHHRSTDRYHPHSHIYHSHRNGRGSDTSRGRSILPDPCRLLDETRRRIEAALLGATERTAREKEAFWRDLNGVFAQAHGRFPLPFEVDAHTSPISALSRLGVDVNNMMEAAGRVVHQRRLLINSRIIPTPPHISPYLTIAGEVEEMAIGCLPDGRASRRILNSISMWRDALHESTSQDGQAVKIAVVGEYSSGKTSLLKRLLLDLVLEAGRQESPLADRIRYQLEGRDMAIGAAPTTSTAREIELLPGRLHLMDTPGFQAGRNGDEEQAKAALSHCSAIIVVLPPQLFTGDTAPLAEAIRIVPEADLPDLLFCISRVDELGADPLLDRGELKRRCDGKERELERIMPGLLRPSPPSHPHLSRTRICTVAPSPFGSLNMIHSRENYMKIGEERVPEEEVNAHLLQFSYWDGYESMLNRMRSMVDRHGTDGIEMGVCRHSLFVTSRLLTEMRTCEAAAERSCTVACRLDAMLSTRIDMRSVTTLLLSQADCPVWACLEKALSLIDELVSAQVKRGTSD